MNKRWIYIGCGGCLGLIVIATILIGGGLLAMKRYANSIATEFRELQQDRLVLQQEFPYEDLGTQPLDPQRFQDYLSVRDATLEQANQRLAWLNSFINPSVVAEEPSLWQTFRNFLNLPTDLAQIGRMQISSLREQKMSLTEYTVITRTMAAEINTWLQLEPSNDLHVHAQQYMRSIDQINDYAEQQKQENPGTRIDLGPFQKREFIREIEGYVDPEHRNRELFTAHAKRIVSSPYASLIDAWTVVGMPDEWTSNYESGGNAETNGQ